MNPGSAFTVQHGNVFGKKNKKKTTHLLDTEDNGAQSVGVSWPFFIIIGHLCPQDNLT